ncbi:hypothetical protein [Streptomyces triticiradicis]|uniref:Uncharacterized protein n=1 Tax=Streptomyces triticiradicis TaxID=2651189 RepID=A0A7J5DJM5_9ACTN|nr:hypothetical protein [Streptomyces triticiradicis]KAB1988908.1 hypothetical protein F8144_10195 [Streptomyces triticiradicis]
MADDSQKAPLGDQIKSAGVLAGFAAWALTMGALGLVLLGFLLLFLLIVGAVLYVAWQVSWAIGLGVTLVVLYVIGLFVTGEKI